MTPELIDRYQPGGDIYQSLAKKYSVAAAQAAANAALTGDETAINAALTTAIYGQPLDTSTASIFLNQIETDPLGAPLADLNSLFGNSVTSFLKSPYVVGAVVIGAFLYLGGIEVLRETLKNSVKK